MSIPRSEHPNPQFMRESWVCLNGEWDFEIDQSVSGKSKKALCEGRSFQPKDYCSLLPGKQAVGN